MNKTPKMSSCSLQKRWKNYSRDSRYLKNWQRCRKIAEFLKNLDAHGKRIKTATPKKATPKEQRNLVLRLKKREADNPTAQREFGLTHKIRQAEYNYVQGS